jgi:hypothetical protein
MSNNNWVRNLYFYLVMLISLFFLVIGMFNIIRTTYIYNFAPRLLKQEVQYVSVGGFDNKCYPQPKIDSIKGETNPVDQDACDKQVNESKGIWLEQNLTWSILAVVLSALVMATHYILMGKSIRWNPTPTVQKATTKK